LQFSLQAASLETFWYTLVDYTKTCLGEIDAKLQNGTRVMWGAFMNTVMNLFAYDSRIKFNFIERRAVVGSTRAAYLEDPGFGNRPKHGLSQWRIFDVYSWQIKQRF
jgi:hypothetical protein